MTALVVPTVEVFFDDVSTTELILDSPTRGLLDTAELGGGTGGLSGTPTDVTDACYAVDIDRGRARETDEIATGTATVRLRNYDARWLPISLNESRLTDEAGVPLTDEDGGFVWVNDSGVYEGLVDIGKRVRISVVGQTIYDGVIDDWDYSYGVDGTVDASFVAMDVLGVLARRSLDAFTATASQSPGERIAAVLDRDEVDFGSNRDIDAGAITLGGDAVSAGENVNSYLKAVALADQGRLFASRGGLLTYRDRLTTAGPTSLATFADDGSGFPFHAIEVATSADLLYTRVNVTREGGTTQTAENATAQTTYGIRTLDLSGLLMESDTQAADLAGWLSTVYGTPTNRVSSITVLLESLSSDVDRATVAALEIGDTVTLVWTPTGTAGPVTQLSYIDGVSHSTSVYSTHSITFALTPVAQESVFVLDDATYGLLDGVGLLTF